MRQPLTWFLILLLLIIIQTTIFSFPFFFPLFLVLAVFWPPQEGFLLAFSSGFALDLFAGTDLGRGSLALLLVAGLVNAYKKRYFSTHPAYTLTLAFVGFLLFNFLVGRQLLLSTTLFVALLSLPAGWLIRSLVKEKEELKI